jgi:hypothetical protein
MTGHQVDCEAINKALGLERVPDELTVLDAQEFLANTEILVIELRMRFPHAAWSLNLSPGSLDLRCRQPACEASRCEWHTRHNWSPLRATDHRHDTVTNTNYYYLGGQRVAMRVGSTVYWLHGDHLGSASMATNASGTKVSETRYYRCAGAAGTCPRTVRSQASAWRARAPLAA